MSLLDLLDLANGLEDGGDFWNDPEPAPTLAERFAAFHEANPRVYIELKRLSLDLVAHGRRHFGIAMIYETLRYQVSLRTHGDPYKLNNDFRAFYSRMLMEEEPLLAGVFETRKQHVDRLGS